MAILIKGHHTEPFRIWYIIAKYSGASLFRIGCRLPHQFPQARAIEDIVTQHHGAAIIADKLLANKKACAKPSGEGCTL